MSRFELIDRTEFTNGYKHVEFFCPGCKCQHAFRIAGSKDVGPIWDWNGDLDKATFSPSLLYQGGPNSTRCHSFVRDGRIQFLDDCSHELKGQTVDVPEDE
jgi:hypothetical protein